MASQSLCPVKRSNPPEASATTSDGCGSGGGGGGGAPAEGSRCPVVRKGDASADVLNPANAMPATPNQQPAPGQRVPLSTHRVTSTIPSTTGSEPLWVYPSEQMFFNAMRRKGYEPREEEMHAVIAIHNSVNERTWSQVLEWERTLHPECADALKLVRFTGKPDEPTPKARARSLVGYAAPFDRHDWVLSRCGKEVTYLIDFYNGRPTPTHPVAMHIDARPMADDLQGVWDRVRMPFMGLWRSAAAMAMPSAPAGSPPAAATAAATPPKTASASAAS